MNVANVVKILDGRPVSLYTGPFRIRKQVVVVVVSELKLI
jgi:hypothetical protein